MAGMPQLPKRTHPEVQSSLEDSTYDLMSDVSSQISDDDGRTTSIASTDDHCPTPEEDDLTALSSTQVVGPEESIYTHPDDEEDGDQESLHNSTVGASVDSEMTTRALTEPTIPSAAASIVETKSTGEHGKHTVVVHRFRTFDEKSMPEPLQIFEKPEITASVEYSMSKDCLESSEKPFNVLFLGDPTHNDAILRKIGSALALSTSKKSNRKHIVQVGDFGGPSPTVELLDSFWPDIVTQTCKSILRPGSSSILLVLDDDRLVKLSPKASRSVLRSQFGAGHAPDLVVISYAPETSIRRDAEGPYSKLKAVRDILKNASFPIVDVSMVSPFDEHHSLGLFDARSLRVKFTAPDEVTDEPVVISETPISPNFFLGMDSSRLNRHLNCILGEPKTQFTRDYLQESLLLFGNAIDHAKTGGAMLKTTLSPSNLKKMAMTRVENAKQLDVEILARLMKALAVFALLASTIWIGMSGSAVGPKGETAVEASNSAGTANVMKMVVGHVKSSGTFAAPSINHAALSSTPSSVSSTKTELAVPTEKRVERVKDLTWDYVRNFDRKPINLNKIQVTSKEKSQISIRFDAEANLASGRVCVLTHRLEVTPLSPPQCFLVPRDGYRYLIKLDDCEARGPWNVTVVAGRGRQSEVKSWLLDMGHSPFGRRALDCWLEDMKSMRSRPNLEPAQQAVLTAQRKKQKEEIDAWIEQVHDRVARLNEDLNKHLNKQVFRLSRSLNSISEAKYVKRARTNGSNLMKKVHRVGSQQMKAYRKKCAEMIEARRLRREQWLREQRRFAARM